MQTSNGNFLFVLTEVAILIKNFWEDIAGEYKNKVVIEL